MDSITTFDFGQNPHHPTVDDASAFIHLELRINDEKLRVISLVLVLFSLIALAQEPAKKSPAPAAVVSGDRLFLHENDDQVWKVANPAALKGHEGLAVAVRCNVGSEREMIHVLSVRTEKLTYSAYKGDSAFRR